MHGPGTRSGRMVLLTSGIVDERPRSARTDCSVLPSLFTQGAGVEPAAGSEARGPDTLLSSQRSGF
jgi:hypothetical protein